MRPGSDHLEPLVQEARSNGICGGPYMIVSMRPRAAFFCNALAKTRHRERADAPLAAEI